MNTLRQCEEAFLDPDGPRPYRVPEMSEELYEDLRREREMEMAEQNIDDGGPAFPRSPYVGEDAHCMVPDDSFTKGHPGMTLLDYFAGQAPEPGIQELAHVMGIPDDTPRERHDKPTGWKGKCVREVYEAMTGEEKFTLCAKYKYTHAAAMLAERKRRMGGQ